MDRGTDAVDERGRRAPLSIALLGTRGVPARYGGFETAVEEVGRRLAARGHTVRVYCRRGNGGEAGDAATFAGMELVHVPALRRRSLETLSSSALASLHLAARRTDVAVVLNAANAPFLPLLRVARIPVATHVDGLEWRRAKWSGAGRRFYRWAERAAVRRSDALVADAQGIADYYAEELGARTRLLAYGAPDVAASGERVRELGLEPDAYHLVVARFEPENHVHLAVEGYVRSSARLPLVVVGSAPYDDTYTRRVHAAAGGDARVRFLGGVWDAALLDDLYAGARTYVHGHSVGGTNPSLLRAIGAGTATLAYDVVFNREVLRHDGRYFADAAALAALVDDAEADPGGVAARGDALRVRAKDYDWDDVADGYEQLAYDLRDGRVPGPQRGRRTGAPRWTGEGA